MGYKDTLPTGFGDGTAWKKFLEEVAEDFQMVTNACHRRLDEDNECDTADAEDEATCKALADALKADYNAHRVLTSVHFTEDDTNDVASSAAGTMTECVTLANELKADFNAHLEDTGHVFDDDSNEVETANASGGTDSERVTACIPLLNEIKTNFNAHLKSRWTKAKTE